MRRPAMTRAQRQHAKEQRALLRLRRAAVRYSSMSEGQGVDTVTLAFAFAELTAACDLYSNAIPTRERRRLSK